MSTSKYRKQIMEYAERKAGAVVQFAGMAGVYELSRSDPGSDRFASPLRAAKDSGTRVSFEIQGNRIVSAE